MNDQCSSPKCPNKPLYYKPDGQAFCEPHNESQRAILEAPISLKLARSDYHQASRGSLTRRNQRKVRYARMKLEIQEVYTEPGCRTATGAIK